MSDEIAHETNSETGGIVPAADAMALLRTAPGLPADGAWKYTGGNVWFLASHKGATAALAAVAYDANGNVVWSTKYLTSRVAGDERALRSVGLMLHNAVAAMMRERGQEVGCAGPGCTATWTCGQRELWAAGYGYGAMGALIEPELDPSGVLGSWHVPKGVHRGEAG